MSIAKDSLLEWERCDKERRELDRKSNTLKDRCDQLASEFEAELKASGKQSIIRHGFTLAFVAGRATVAWAEAFLRECGPEKANALKAEAASNVTQKLSITVPN